LIVQDIVSALSVQVVAGADHLNNQVSGGYASDLLSCVMAGAKAGDIWVTLQSHPNVVAVADLLNLAAVVITEGTQPNAETVSRADEKGIPVLLAQQNTFDTVGSLIALGIGKRQ
jgi:predicted transcriptional regulator